MSSKTSVTADKTPKVYPPLEVPNPSPQVGINDPDFAKLTAAEKLNDGDYRNLVYQTYPDEPTCACEPSHKEVDTSESPAGNFLVCRSGCKNACCSSMRQSGVASSRRDNANKNDKLAPFIPTYCVGNKRDSMRNVYNEDGRRSKASHNSVDCCGKNRLRGGGEERGEKGMYSQSGKVSGTMVRWLDDVWNERKNCVVERRLDGGGCVGLEYVERHPLNRSLASDSRAPRYNMENLRKEYPRAQYSRNHPDDSNIDKSNYGRAMTYTSAWARDSNEPIAAGCCCPGKETFIGATRERENNETRGKKPLPAVDRLVKTFRETQEFVDSLGKVPGLAGLGLMDPAESPYFGRSRTKKSDLEGPKTADKFSTFTNLPNPQCTGPCNAQILRSTNDGVGGQSDGTIPFTINVPGRGGIIREAVPVMPGPGLIFPTGKSRKKDDKDKPKEADPSTALTVDTDASPCGEPKCKAKRRKDDAPEGSAPVEAAETATKKILTLANPKDKRTSRTSHKIKAINKMHSGRKSSDMLGHGVDRNGRKRSSGKFGRRIISFVYTAGDTYSGEARSHKNCIEERHRVPGNMGWLWNLNETVGRLKPRPGWRPGAIGRRVNEILREAKANLSHVRKSRTKSSRSSSRSRSRSAPSRGKRSKTHSDRGSVKRTQSKNVDDDKEEIEPPPTLHIHRKDGTYYVTMYPIKQDIMDVPKLEEPMKPLQFKIAKNKDDGSVASSSTASDMEIEFSPPAAVNRYRKKPNVIHVDTQVKQHEINDAFKSKSDDGGKMKDKKKGKKSKK